MPADDAPVLPDWPALPGLSLPTPEATDAIAARIGARLAPGDTMLLSGHLGSGKSHFARALIRARLRQPDLPVPSPTFTLVQTYATPDGASIWHADLYRITNPGEVAELGLDEAFDSAICLVEWPDRLAPDWPDAVLLHMEATGGTSRHLDIHAPRDLHLARKVAEAVAP